MPRLLGRGGLLGIVLALLALPGPAAADYDPRDHVIALVNMERERAGLPPLVWQPHLHEAAEGYAAVLSRGDCWAHTCGPIPDFTHRAAVAGYFGWHVLGENLAAGQGSAEAVVAGWMASPAHRANILNPAFTEIGVGLGFGGPYGIYWVQEFGG